ncbi:MAG: hypothetical protein KC503_37495 [Myxococcales bacterium]|nr:hypothetical protein [Myxococcales bacterium]
MDAEQRALLSAVVAAPNDVERRRVYGDFLSARGDTRGEHLQLCLNAREAHDQTRRDELLSRAAELRRREQRRWLAPLYNSALFDYQAAPHAPALDLDDGLLRGVSCQLSQLLDSADAVAELGALREVRLVCDDSRRLGELGSCAAVAHVEHVAIDFGAQPPPPERLVEAFGGAVLRQRALRSLELEARDQPLDGVLQALAGLAPLGQIERLAVRAPVGSRGARAIARGFARLVDLEFRGGAEAVATLATELSVAPLRLCIRGRIGPTAAEALLTSGLLFRLRELELEDSVMGWQGMRALAGSAQELGQLERLALRGAQLEDDASHIAGMVKHLQGLRELDLGRSHLTRASVRAIVACGLSSLESLSLDGAILAGWPGLARALDHWSLPRLERLSLRDCRIDRPGFAALGASPRLAALRELDLAHSELDDDGALALARGDGLASLRALDLTGNALGGSGLTALAVSPVLDGARRLVLADLPLGDDGARALAQSHAAMRALEALVLRDTMVGAAGARALLCSSHLAELRELSLLTGDIGGPALDALCHSPSLRRLEALEVRHGRDAALARFAAAARHGAPRLRALDISGVTDACVPALTRAEGFSELERLRLAPKLAQQSAQALRERFTPLVYWP